MNKFYAGQMVNPQTSISLLNLRERRRPCLYLYICCRRENRKIVLWLVLGAQSGSMQIRLPSDDEPNTCHLTDSIGKIARFCKDTFKFVI